MQRGDAEERGRRQNEAALPVSGHELADWPSESDASLTVVHRSITVIRMVRSGTRTAESGRFRVGVVMVYCLCGLSIFGCGSQSEMVPLSPGPSEFAGVSYKTVSAVTFAGGRAGSVMVDGYNEGGGEPHVRVRFLPTDGSAMQVFDDHEAVPLQGVLAWLSGTDLIITGTACPQLSLAAATATEGNDLQAICGATRQVVRHLDLDDGTWTVIDDDLAHDRFPLHPSFGDAPFALMGMQLDARIRTDGTIEPLDTSAFPPEASLNSCVGRHGALAHAASWGPENAHLGTFVLKGETWEKVDSKGATRTADAEGAGVSYYCSADGLVAVHVRPNAPQTAPSYELFAVGSDDEATYTAIDPPPTNPTAGGPPLMVDGAGLLLAVDAQDGTTFVLRDGVWHRLDGRSPSDGTVARIVVGDRVNWVAAPNGDTFGGQVSAGS